ncbi:uncharacterized protein PV07_06518 [Cladophialophora immunda]|uniref:Uncharacterized protein n=1 Tax=Cladophialophora immunda TaxID=569365 RepID=A0A0D2ANN0_9EURO|nr:uncharacterized protein PV07_06518 [Cladophialophora immunda]KIW26707.1 hypothetical protein PV07_06518 [Cladophialophora immunda]OQV01974.1 hypothetical protein CLAIMM_07241 [Cladophialophora immunda]
MNKKLALQTDASALIPKKYRGDDDDPHFIPDSPLIDRQALTAQEEGELKRICALVLANVPHSDDMSDDPLKYIAAQIQEGKTAQKQPGAKRERKPEPAHNVEAAASVTHQFLDIQDDSATPSEVSLRGTITATDYSTPLTSAGITPGETARRFSDAARKSVNSTKKPGSSLRNESTTVTTKSRTTSSGGIHRSMEASKPSAEAEAIKKTLRIVTDGSSRPQSGSTKSMEQPRPIRFSAPDLNKRLPPPPPESPVPEEQKQPHISRLMKTIRKKKSMTTEGRSFSTGSTPPMPSATTPRTPYPHSSTTPVTDNAAQEPPRKKFRIPLFHRRQRPADVLVT